MKIEKIILGESDYSRDQIENGIMGSGILDRPWGDQQAFRERIENYEKIGWRIEFETSLWQRLFGVGKYKVIAYANPPQKTEE